MFSLTRIQLLKLATAGGLLLLTAANPARSDDLLTNLGPVGPHEPILASVGSERLIAFYAPDSDHCAVNAVVWDDRDTDKAVRVRISLSPQQIVHFESVEQQSINLQCGDKAETLAVVENRELVAFGVTK
jgi:hypothetical protein